MDNIGWHQDYFTVVHFAWFRVTSKTYLVPFLHYIHIANVSINAILKGLGSKIFIKSIPFFMNSTNNNIFIKWTGSLGQFWFDTIFDKEINCWSFCFLNLQLVLKKLNRVDFHGNSLRNNQLYIRHYIWTIK